MVNSSIHSPAVGLTGELTVDLNVSMNGSLSLCVSPATDWQPFQSIFSSYTLQLEPPTPTR